MTIDVRAVVTCNLGELISASISDDYIQGSGLIKTKGNCEIKGIINPTPGDTVVFEYSKQGITRRIPRTLRVLSSFADPFRRVTSVELGCKLTYLQDLREPFVFRAEDDPENAEIIEDEGRIVTLPIRARKVAKKCLEELGISGSVNFLTNEFSIAEFDLGSGYVNVLSDLLVSECYCGYLDESEKLVAIELNEKGGSGPLIDSESLIDIGPIGVGQLSGDAVFVSYSSLILKAPDGVELVCGADVLAANEEDGGPEVVTDVSTSEIVVAYTVPGTDVLATKTFNIVQTAQQGTFYGLLEIDPNVITYAGTTTQTFTSLGFYLSVTRVPDGRIVPDNILRDPNKEYKRVILRRVTVETETAPRALGALVTAYLNNGVPVPTYQLTSVTTETYSYDNLGNEKLKIIQKVGPAAYAIGLLGVPMEINGSVATIPLYQVTLEKTTIETSRIGGYEEVVTKRYGQWAASISGQQSIAESRDSFTSILQVNAYVADAVNSQAGYLLDVTVSTRPSSPEDGGAPSQEDVANAVFTNQGDPNNGFRTESVSETEVSFGDPKAQRRIELTMPYAPDDTFVAKLVAGSSPPRYCYFSKKSDAAQKAKNFGRTQNRMLLGNRKGMNIQMAPERLPSAPFAPVFIQAAGTIALYRVNAASWTIDSTGIVASTDAMFWGTAGSV
jgi:hypothetical protein